MRMITEVCLPHTMTRGERHEGRVDATWDQTIDYLIRAGWVDGPSDFTGWTVGKAWYDRRPSADTQPIVYGEAGWKP